MTASFGLAEAKKLVLEVGEPEDSPCFRTAVVLLMMTLGGCGADFVELRLKTFYDHDFLKKVCRRAREVGVVQEGGRTFHINWGDKDEGDISFVLDVMTVVGELKRTEKDGKFLYQYVEGGAEIGRRG